jgi:hypothetical protein
MAVQAHAPASARARVADASAEEILRRLEYLVALRDAHVASLSLRDQLARIFMPYLYYVAWIGTFAMTLLVFIVLPRGQAWLAVAGFAALAAWGSRVLLTTFMAAGILVMIAAATVLTLIS